MLMGPSAILFPIFYLLCVALLAVLVLTCVPRFRLNGSNVLLFIVGAIVGHVATAVPIERLLYHSGYLREIPEGFALPFILAGAIVGGLSSVALRMRLTSASQKHENSPPRKIRN